MRKITFDLSPEQRRVQHLISYSNSLSNANWTYEGEVLAEKSGKGITVHGRASWSRHRGECVLDHQYLFGHHLMSNGSYGTFIPDEEYVSLSGRDGVFISEQAHVTNTHHAEGEIVTLRMFDLGTGNLEAKTSSQGLILAGVDLADWPMGFPIDDEGNGASVDGMVTTIFGRDALIRRMPTETEAGHDMLVAFDGQPLEPLQQSALWLVMSFLSGRSGNVVGSIGIEGNREVWRRHHMWTSPLHAAHPPLDAHRWNRAVFDLPTRFPDMLDHALGLLHEDIAIDVALTHLFADSRGHLDVEIRDITLALDALIEANAFASKEAHVIEPDEYEELLPAIDAALAEALKEHPKSQSLRERIMDRVKGSNDISHGERRRKFLARVGFELKSDEKDALDNRHPMSHKGFILRKAETEEHQALSNHVRLARTFVNRVILALLGYDGPVFDYSTGLTQPWQYFIERDVTRKRPEIVMQALTPPDVANASVRGDLALALHECAARVGSD